MTLAQSFCVTYGLAPGQATMQSLLGVCFTRGIYVHFARRLDRPAWYLKRPGVMPVIMLGPQATAWHLAHELWHDIHDGAEPGIHPYTRGSSRERERQAEAFARTLCGTRRRCPFWTRYLRTVDR